MGRWDWNFMTIPNVGGREVEEKVALRVAEAATGRSWGWAIELVVHEGDCVVHVSHSVIRQRANETSSSSIQYISRGCPMSITTPIRSELTAQV